MNDELQKKHQDSISIIMAANILPMIVNTFKQFLFKSNKTSNNVHCFFQHINKESLMDLEPQALNMDPDFNESPNNDLKSFEVLAFRSVFLYEACNQRGEQLTHF